MGSLEDLSGQVEVLVFSKAYAAHEELLKRDEPVYIKGRVLMEDEPEDGGEATAKLRAEDVKSLADIRAAQARRVMIHVKAEVAEKGLPALQALAKEYAGPCFLRFQMHIPEEGYVVLDADPNIRVSAADDFVQRAEQILGRGTVEVL